MNTVLPGVHFSSLQLEILEEAHAGGVVGQHRNRQHACNIGKTTSYHKWSSALFSVNLYDTNKQHYSHNR